MKLVLSPISTNLGGEAIIRWFICLAVSPVESRRAFAATPTLARDHGSKRDCHYGPSLARYLVGEDSCEGEALF